MVNHQGITLAYNRAGLKDRLGRQAFTAFCQMSDDHLALVMDIAFSKITADNAVKAEEDNVLRNINNHCARDLTREQYAQIGAFMVRMGGYKTSDVDFDIDVMEEAA